MEDHTPNAARGKRPPIVTAFAQAAHPKTHALRAATPPQGPKPSLDGEHIQVLLNRHLPGGIVTLPNGEEIQVGVDGAYSPYSEGTFSFLPDLNEESSRPTDDLIRLAKGNAVKIQLTDDNLNAGRIAPGRSAQSRNVGFA
jgi:hypothetical protein